MEATCTAILGNVYNIQMVGNSHFKGIFWSFSASITGWKCCQPILSLDGTFLLGKYHGTLLVVVEINGSLFLPAFKIIKVESNESWTWFMQMPHNFVRIVSFDLKSSYGIVLIDEFLGGEEMARWETTISIVMGVVIRKSLCCFAELGLVMLDLISVFMSTVRFSSFFFRQQGPFSGDSQNSPYSSMLSRHDR
ncbi:hypothetical protein M5K25_006997 [Dendrobium thyrsiflorum]|uniref:MULE transposase domain-containing protein n=1 Tax=Dendrobium thyrsiflorum TaxID=117978 RepID=A0ABD0VK62_DENTH